MKEITLKLKEDNNLNLGQTLYTVENLDKAIQFREKCPICDDTGEITYRGRKYNCPECVGRISNNDPDSLYLRKWEIVDYIINEVTVKCPEIKSYYKSENPEGMIEFEAFHKMGNGFNSSRVRNINLQTIITSEEQIANMSRYYTYYFLDKKLAKKALKNFIDKDKKKLEEFNNFHGTNYKYPFEEEK